MKNIELGILLLLLLFFTLHASNQYFEKFIPSYEEKKIHNISQNNNSNRHQSTKKAKYAHFSKVTQRTPSLLKFPLFYLSHPKEYVVNEGECLYIPKGWWHWVVSFENNSSMCLSYNYWFDKSINNDKPYITKCSDLKQLQNVFYKFKEKIKSDNSTIYLWCDNQGGKNTTMDDFINNDRYKDCYVITLNAFKKVSNNYNNNFFENMKKMVPMPTEIQKEKIHETNFWLNKGNIDTGLHRDDYDGFLCVISGKKVVTLFPPSDAKFLYPYDD